MRGLNNLVVALLLLSIAVPASVLLISKVREYADVARSQTSFVRPATLVAYLFKNSNENLLIVCNYGLRTIEDIRIVDSAGNHTQVVSSLAPKTCYLTSLPSRNWYLVIAENQVVNVLRVS